MKSRRFCLDCDRELVLHRTGRPKLYCSPTCRKRHYRRTGPRQLSLVPELPAGPGLPPADAVTVCSCCGQEMLPRR